MEKLSKTEILELKATTTLEHILPKDFDPDSFFEKPTFELRQPLTKDTTIVYSCQFQNVEQAEYYYLKAKQADEADKPIVWGEWMEKLIKQKITILNAELLNMEEE